MQTIDSIYTNFPLKITLYQYETSPYSSQLRSYLDYFGFKYEFIEVDPYTQVELKAITRRPKIPILVLEDEKSQKKWYLTNSSSTMSALESLRNEFRKNNEELFGDSKELNVFIKKFLPLLRTFNDEVEDSEEKLKYPNKYLVSNDTSEMK